ncbi:hypothetical protein HHK36_010086 [Tetracentron sinense]|uniref:HVA22-like protein n=1 Tax=Tetracentron sinense TaxID=13715 RepID=A0A834ZK65_TETSI|nr:hypothetical protein HHK36_010086 [Tetracentron sinense]
MVLPGSNISSEVGLRLLLCPFGSNVVIRTACCSAGIVLPVYSTFKAIEKKDQNEQQRWLLYWTASHKVSLESQSLRASKLTDPSAWQKCLQTKLSLGTVLNPVGVYLAIGCGSVLEADYICGRQWDQSPLQERRLEFPLYYHMKFAFLVWLQLPSSDGARHLYMSYLRPFLLRHQARLDQIVGLVYGEMAKFISAHQAEFQFVRGMLVKILASGNKMLRDIIHPVQARGHNAIEGPTRQNQDSESDNDN